MVRSLILLSRKTFLRKKTFALSFLLLGLILYSGVNIRNTYLPVGTLIYFTISTIICTDASSNFTFKIHNTNLTGLLPVSRKEIIIFKYTSSFTIGTILFVLHSIILNTNPSFLHISLAYFIIIMTSTTCLFMGNLLKDNTLLLPIVLSFAMFIYAISLVPISFIPQKISLPVYVYVLLLGLPAIYSLLMAKTHYRIAQKCDFKKI